MGDVWPSGVARPAQRALANRGISKVTDLAAYRESEIAQLHGMGPRALGILKAELEKQGLSFRQ